MFIRIKKRKSSSGQTRSYAYLVASDYYRKGPRQKVKKYLGRAYELVKQKKSGLILKKDFKRTAHLMLINELKAHGFKLNEKVLTNSSGLKVALENLTVKDATGKNVGLCLNHGVCCEYTLTKVFGLPSANEQGVKLGKILGKYLLEAGFEVTREEFVRIFELLIKDQSTMINDLQQCPTIPNNAQQ